METPAKLNSNPLVRDALARIPSSQEALMVARRVLTPKQTPYLNFQYRTYGTEYQELVLDDMRAWDGLAKMIRTERDLASVSIFGRALKTLIDPDKVKEAGADGPAYVAGELAVIREVLLLAREYRTLTMVTTAGNYDGSHKDGGAVKFDAAGIIDNVLGKHDAIIASCGRKPTSMLMDPISRRLARNNAEIKATQADGVRITDEVLAEVFEVNEIVRSEVMYRARKGATMTPIFSEKALLFVREDSENVAFSDMSLGRMVYIPAGDGEFDVRQGNPQGAEGLYEVGVFMQSEPVIANWGAAYLFEDTTP